MSWLSDDEIKRRKSHNESNNLPAQVANMLARKWYSEVPSTENTLTQLLKDVGNRYVDGGNYTIKRTIVKVVDPNGWSENFIVDPKLEIYEISLSSNMRIALTLMVPPRNQTALITLIVIAYADLQGGYIQDFSVTIDSPGLYKYTKCLDIVEIQGAIKDAVIENRIGRIFKKKAGLFSPDEWVMDAGNKRIHLGKA